MRSGETRTSAASSASGSDARARSSPGRQRVRHQLTTSSSVTTAKSSSRGRPGRAAEVTLERVAPELVEARELRRSFDALGDDAQLERAGEADDCAHDGFAAVVLVESLHERAVDLEHLDREGLEVRQRRVTRAEVVDDEMRAEAAQRREDARRGRRVVHQHALGDLEPECVGFEAGIAQDGLDLTHEVRVVQLAGREVHRDVEVARRRIGCAPAGRLGASGREHLDAEREDEVGLFGDANELVGRDRTELGMREPGERLDAEDARRGDGDDRLVVHVDLVVLERGAQPELDLAATFGLHAEVGVEDLDLGATELLRPAHRDVRIAEELFRVAVAAGRERDPDAGVQRGLASVGQADRFGDHPFELDRALGDRLDAGDVAAHDDELVAGDATDAIHRARSRPAVAGRPRSRPRHHWHVRACRSRA